MRYGLSRLLHARAATHGPLVLMYHSIAKGSRRPAWPWAISFSAFAAQLDFLLETGYTTHPFASLENSDPQGWSGRHVVITFDDGYRDNLAAADALSTRGMTATWFVLSGNLGHPPRWEDPGGPREPLMSGTEIRELQSAGFEIASHGVEHVRLTNLDDNALDYQLAASREQLTALLGREVQGLAYPYGAWDTRVAAAAVAAGYRQACTTRPGWALRDSDPMRVRRLMISNTDTPATFARKMAWASNDPAWSTAARERCRWLLRRQ